MKNKKFVILDGHAILYRAWHALPLLQRKDGLVVNVIYGYFNILFKILNDLKPDYLATAFDLGEETFRHKEFTEYKATREKQDESFYKQIPLLQEALKELNIQIFTKKGYEADDVIGSIANQIKNEHSNIDIIIISGDNDLLQLVQDRIYVYMPKIGVSNFKLYDEKAVIEKFKGLKPKQIIDYKALKGDPSDNIPGVKGIGDKTATQLLLNFQSIQNIYKLIDEQKEDKLKTVVKDRIINLLKEYRENAFLSYDLAKIITNLKIKNFKLENCIVKGFSMKTINTICKEYEFFTLAHKVPEFLRIDDEDNKNQESLTYTLINNYDDFTDFIKKAEKENILAFDSESSSLNIDEAEIIGLSFSWAEGKAYYINLNHKDKLNWLNILKEKILENIHISKIAHNFKYDWKLLKKYNIDVKGKIIDTMLAAYVLNPDRSHYDLDHLSFSELNLKTTTFEDLTGIKGKKENVKDIMLNLDLNKLKDYACQDADFTFRLWQHFEDEIYKRKIEKLYFDIEIPLIKILGQMELNGIKIDLKYFEELKEEFEKRLNKIDLEIFQLAGERFNINSPKQIKEILFDKLNINPQNLKKTKTGYSTSAEELEKIKNEHPIIKLILEHRHISKLLNTYIESLPKLVKSDGRLHTSFNQTITRTGRLSSTNPNLQNIPIKDEDGRKIRKGFIAEKNKILISADYSQIELRIIASLANDEEMIKAFQNGEDIHSSTAAKIYNIDLKDVTKELRAKAKAINFGVIYGLSAYGLAKQLEITQKEAQEFIDKYFKLYKGIKKYIEDIIEFAKEHNYVETLFKRRRYIYDINSTISNIRKAAERTAINTPIQGTAADLLKLAMIQINKEILQNNENNIKLLLQVHDELIFEADEDKADKFIPEIKNIMENIHQFKVPIIVNIEKNKSWGEMH